METFAQYTQVTGSSTTMVLSVLVSAVTGTFGISSGESPALWQSFNNNMAAVTGAMGTANTITPKAYLVWIFINDNDQYVNSGGQAITTSAYNAFEKLSRSFTATQNGDLYIYVANESNVSTATNVYFDEFYIVHQKNTEALQVLQASDYYPFGLSFNHYNADRLKETSPGNYTLELRNRYLFQGQELQKDLDLGWYQYKYRMHDPAIGRFSAVDPMAAQYVFWSPYSFSGNQLIGKIELEGLEPTSTREDALIYLNAQRSTLQTSDIWTRITPAQFLDGLRQSITDPLSINQGKDTYFCGFAAGLSYIAEKNPRGYAEFMVNLYNSGSSSYNGKTFKSSPEIHKSAGLLDYDGLKGNSANQMAFLTMAENYGSGYLNLFGGKYSPGKEATTRWAGTSLGEFTTMMRDFGYKVNTLGYDALNGLDYLGSAQRALKNDKDVFLFVNSPMLKENAWYKNWTGTHYMRLFSVETLDRGNYRFGLWDYGKNPFDNYYMSSWMFNFSTYGLITVERF